MKNRISMALKDPTLQQGFEIICKENAELKADNDARKYAMAMSEKVEKQLREENKDLADCNSRLLSQAAAATKRVIQQEKVNEELEVLRCCENCKNVNLQLHWRESEEIDKMRQFVCGTCGNRKHWEYLGKTVGITETQQLTKAKELLTKWVELFKPKVGNIPPTPIQVDTEQFLKEIEK